MADRNILVDIFDEVVEAVRAAYNENYDPVEDLTPRYLYGHPLDIAAQLEMLNDSDIADSKFPLIALLQDFREEHSKEYDFAFTVPQLKILILYYTDENFISSQRYENVFKPILYPIYKLLLEAMADNTDLFIDRADEIAHDKIDRLYWGKEGIYFNTAVIFNEHLDGIELIFKNLRVNTTDDC